MARESDSQPARRRRPNGGDRGCAAARHHPSFVRTRLLPIVALLLLCVAKATAEIPSANARPDFYSRRVWQSSDGLPEDFTQAFAQTPDGYLWIGTSGGLARFDGVRFVVFNSRNESAFTDDSVYSLLVARDGTLWAGTEGGGLIRYQQGTFRVFSAAHGLANPFVRVLYEDRAGRLWVGTDLGLF